MCKLLMDSSSHFDPVSTGHGVIGLMFSLFHYDFNLLAENLCRGSSCSSISSVGSMLLPGNHIHQCFDVYFPTLSHTASDNENNEVLCYQTDGGALLDSLEFASNC